jgi:hypothetical protein
LISPRVQRRNLTQLSKTQRQNNESYSPDPQLIDTLNKVFVPHTDETLGKFRERITKVMNEEYRKNIESLMLELPRNINYLLRDSQPIDLFRKTLLLNKFRHHKYNPEFDSVFSKNLYVGLVEEAEKIEMHKKYTASNGMQGTKMNN